MTFKDLQKWLNNNVQGNSGHNANNQEEEEEEYRRRLQKDEELKKKNLYLERFAPFWIKVILALSVVWDLFRRYGKINKIYIDGSNPFFISTENTDR
jgi:hypothetical protein